MLRMRRGRAPLAMAGLQIAVVAAASVGIRARAAAATHLSIELDPVRPDDPLRRTSFASGTFRGCM